MGIDTGLAIDQLEDEFVCSICHDILQDPVMISRCEHYFCGSCIRQWIQANSVCPKDRDPAEEAGLAQPCRFFRNKLADVRLRCQFSECNAETTHAGFERHKNQCRHNPDAWMECEFCQGKHMKDEEDTHKNSCVPFLRDTIDKKESEKKELEMEFRRKREADKKQYDEEIERMTKKSRTMRYIFTWNAQFPTPQNHMATNTMASKKTYYTWNHNVRNLAIWDWDRTLKRITRGHSFRLDHGTMAVGLVLKKGTCKRTDKRCICSQFYLYTGKNVRVKFNVSLSSNGEVLWQKERTEELEVGSNVKDGLSWSWTGRNGLDYIQQFADDLPSDLPSNLLVLVEVIEWEPNAE